MILAAGVAPAVVRAASLMPIKRTNFGGVDLSFTSEELTLSLEDFAEKVLRPAQMELATRLDILYGISSPAMLLACIPG